MIVTRRRLSFFARQNVAAGATLKRWLWLSAPANKKIGSGSTLKVTAPAPQHCTYSNYFNSYLPYYFVNLFPDYGDLFFLFPTRVLVPT